MLVRFLALGLTLLCLRAIWSGWGTFAAPSPAVPATLRALDLPAVPLADEDGATDQVIRYLEDRLRSDPENYRAYSKLAGYHLQRLRETGNVQYLGLALGAARHSLAVIPEARNIGGLTVLAQAELAAHDFAAARDHAGRLTALDPDKSLPYGILGDALLELGAYEEANEAFRQMAARGQSVVTETRLARLSWLRGDTDPAQRHLFTALALALDAPAPPRETVAWCRWQFGEMAFAAGDYETAERHYRAALTTFPGYTNALASLGRVRAARGDLAGAIERYQEAVRRLPDPAFVAALGDLHRLAGRERDAATQYALVEQIGHLSAASGAPYNRQLALYYADHDLKAEEAYASAAREYEVRRDVYGADAVAWTALKAGHLAAAQGAMQEALRLGTPDARLYYHAGMIARSVGEGAAARGYLQRALALNPQFDPLQAPIARQALEQLTPAVTSAAVPTAPR